MKYVLDDDGKTRRTMHRDPHAPEKVYVETVSRDRADLERIKRVRDAELIQQGDANPMMDGGETLYLFQFPTNTHYIKAKQAQPDLFHKAEHGTEAERMRAAEQLCILFPMYILSVKKRRLF